MKYVYAGTIIVLYIGGAAILSSFIEMSLGEVLASFTLGGFAILAGDYYTTKEER